MSEFSFDVDTLGRLTLQHFEQADSVQTRESSSSPLSDDLASPLSSPSEVGSPNSLCSTSGYSSSFSTSSDEEPGGKVVEKGKKVHKLRTRGKAVISKRNERERKRVKQIGDGFSTLRKRVFGRRTNDKLPKLHILRSAIDYIKSMERLLAESDRRMELEKQRCTFLEYSREAYVSNAKPEEHCACYHNRPQMAYAKSYHHEPVVP